MPIEYKGRPIDRFEGDYFFLSNFYTGKVFLWGLAFNSAEHAYQYEKLRPYCSPAVLAQLMLIPDPGKFKKAVKHYLYECPEWTRAAQEQWDRVKLQVMETVLRQKFSNILLHDRLDMTAPRELIEGNTLNDSFWGQPVDKHGNRTKPGQNMLGKLLMRIRDDD
jgi:ribA/ribD-fused uncharacterized protein